MEPQCCDKPMLEYHGCYMGVESWVCLSCDVRLRQYNDTCSGG